MCVPQGQHVLYMLHNIILPCFSSCVHGFNPNPKCFLDPDTKIDWRIGEIKMTRCLEECGKQWRLRQERLEWQKQKEENKQIENKQKKKKEKKKKKTKKDRTIRVKKILEEQDIWDEEKAVKSKEKTKKLVLSRFYK